MELTKNYWAHRRDPETGLQYVPKATVLHISGGDYKSTMAWIKNPRSSVSYNWVIYNGHAIEVVPEQHAAWANGHIVRPTWKGFVPAGLGGDAKLTPESEQSEGEKGHSLIVLDEDNLGGGNVIVNPNLYTISVAVINNGENPLWKDWQTWVTLNKQIRLRNNWKINSLNTVNHYEIKATKMCPRPWFTRFYLQLLTNLF